jgi:hypothetical protein
VVVSFLDPRATPARAADRYELQLDPGLAAPTIGILANGFVDSEAFAEHLGDAIVRVRPGTRILLENKGNPSTIVEGERLQRMLDRCDAVITLYGHCGSCTSGVVRDAIIFARQGIPALTLVTENFRDQADFVAGAAGMPAIPRHVLPHPVAARGSAYLAQLAAEVAPVVIDRIQQPASTTPDADGAT